MFVIIGGGVYINLLPIVLFRNIPGGSNTLQFQGVFSEGLVTEIISNYQTSVMWITIIGGYVETLLVCTNQSRFDESTQSFK